MLALFGLPMALRPLRWARVLRWQLPAHTDLAVYFGRCLGCVVVAIGGFSLYAAQTPAVQGFWFRFLVLNGLLMIAVHAYGAIRRTQPVAETVEIALWIALVLLTLCFWPGS